MRLMKLTKMMALLLKVFTPYWRTAEKFYYEKIPAMEKK